MNEKPRKIYDVIYDVFDSLETNNFATIGKPDAAMFERPLIGVAAGDDPYYEFLKSHIGEFHWSPQEVFALKYKDVPDSSCLRVISLVFPQTEETKNMQNTAKVFPCDNWVVSRGEWEPMMGEFASKVEGAFDRMGIRSAALDLRSEFHRQDSENLGIASVWSHRHSAFAAGLGTFGLNDGFISERGIAVRITSIVIEADIDITPRGDIGHYDWCLYYSKGICGACIKRCPVSAISKENGHDKDSCLEYEDYAIEHYWPEHIERGDYIFGCGLCQSRVPCRDRRP